MEPLAMGTLNNHGLALIFASDDGRSMTHGQMISVARKERNHPVGFSTATLASPKARRKHHLQASYRAHAYLVRRSWRCPKAIMVLEEVIEAVTPQTGVHTIRSFNENGPIIGNWA